MVGFDKDEWNIRPEIKSHQVKQKHQKTILLVMKNKLFAGRQGQSVIRRAKRCVPLTAMAGLFMCCKQAAGLSSGVKTVSCLLPLAIS